MDPSPSFRELLFADLALTRGDAPAGEVARALQQYWEAPPDARRPLGEELVAKGALDSQARAAVDREVERLVADAEGDASVALARRGGIDRSIHTSLRPETAQALLRDGAGARAPLRKVADDRYTDFSLVGKGGMGVVYLTLDTELNRKVAFKMVMPDPKAQRDTPAPTTPLDASPPTTDQTHTDEDNVRSFEELRVRFLQEAWVTGAMEHPGVVPVYELGETQAGIPYYTMRYVKGDQTLADAIKATTDVDSRLALLEPFLKVCDTIRYAHSRAVVHRDLKPANIALGEFGEVVVLDWGLSKMQGKPDIHASMWRSRIAEFREAADLATVAGVMGTPGYMAPEAALGKGEDVDEQSDVYSLGSILFEILTRQLPFRFETYLEYVQKILEEQPPDVAKVAPGVPSELGEICARAMARKKEDRFGSVAELAKEVRRWQTEGRLALQIEALMEDATREVEAAGKLGGNMMLWHLDRASADCSKVLHLVEDHEGAQHLLGEIKRLRERGIRERVRGDRRRALVGAGFAILAVAAIATLYVAKILRDEREDANEQLLAERQAAQESRRIAERAEEGTVAARERLAEAYAGLALNQLRSGRVAAARLLADRGIEIARTPRTWAALAAAEARWTPTLRGVWRGMPTADAAFAPDGSRLYVGSKRSIRVVSLATGEVERVLEGHDGAVTALAASQDGTRLASGSALGRIKLWDTGNGHLVRNVPRELKASEDEMTRAAYTVPLGTAVHGIVFHPDGSRLYASYADNGIRYWKADGSWSGGLLHPGLDFNVLTVGPTSRFLYGGTPTGIVAWWSVDGGPEEGRVDTGAPAIGAISVGGDGEHFYAATLDNRLILWDEDTQTTAFQGSAGRAVAVAVTRTRRRFVAADHDGRIRVWDVPSGELLAVLDSVRARVDTLRLSPDGSLLAVGREDGTLRVWDLSMRWHAGTDVPATAALLGENDQRVFLARPDFTIDAWDTESGRVTTRMRGHTASVTALTRDRDGRLYSGSLDGSVRIWEPGRADAAGKLHVQVPVTAIAVTEDAVLIGTLDGEIQAWSLARRRRVPFDGHGDPHVDAPVTAVAVTPDGALLAVGHASGHVRTWNLRDHVPKGAPVRVAGTSIAAVALTPAGTVVCAASEDGRIHRWTGDRPDEVERRTAGIGKTPVHLAFRPDGSVLWLHTADRGGVWAGAGEPADHEETGVKPPPLYGSALPWILKDPLRRLVHHENCFGLMLDQFEVVMVPLETYDPRKPRVSAWSK